MLRGRWTFIFHHCDLVRLIPVLHFKSPRRTHVTNHSRCLQSCDRLHLCCLCWPLISNSQMSNAITSHLWELANSIIHDVPSISHYTVAHTTTGLSDHLPCRCINCRRDRPVRRPANINIARVYCRGA